MSVACMTWVFSHSTAAGGDRLLLLGIADHAGDDGGDAWPSVATLARKTGTSERTVQRGIARLEEGGHLVVDRGAGRGGTNRYRVVMGDGVTPPAGPQGQGRGRQSVTGDALTPVTQPRRPEGDTQVSPERPERPSPQPPASGGRASRANGTNPRALRGAAEATRRRHELTDRAAQRRARRDSIDACGRCGSDGYLPGGGVCDHDPTAPDRAARGIALVRAEMARRTAGATLKP